MPARPLGRTSTWLSIHVELLSGRGAEFWPRPGRVLAASRFHTFAQLAAAVDAAFARWDLAHLHMFTLVDGTCVSPLEWWEGEAPDGTLDGRALKLGRLRPGERFGYVFDLGDDWTHVCTVGGEGFDPAEEFGEVPDRPMAYRGWGSLPDQHGRHWDGDGCEPPRREPSGSPLGGLPPVLPWWTGVSRPP